MLIDYDGRAYLVDFGFARYFNFDEKSEIKQITDPTQEVVMGIGAYMDPEQHNGSSYTNHLADVYSLGVLIHELIFGLVPMLTIEQTYAAQIGDKYQTANATRRLINRCIAPNPNQRPTIVDEIGR